MGKVDELAGAFFGAIQMAASTGAVPVANSAIAFLTGLTLALTLAFSKGFEGGLSSGLGITKTL